MAIKFINALCNLRIDDNIKKVESAVSFLINHFGYAQSQIDSSLILSDSVYISLAEYFGDESLTEGLAHMPGLSGCSSQEFEEFMEDYMNSKIPNREPHSYSDAPKKTIINGKLSVSHEQIVINKSEKKKDVTMKESSVEKKEIKIGNEHADVSQMDIKDLRARLLELFTEQINWQNQLREIGENLSFDDIHHKINQVQRKIEKHRSIIMKCEDCEKRHGKSVRLGVPIEEADSEFTSSEIVKGWDGEPIDVECFYSVEHSQKRIAFLEGEIAKYEQKLQMMEIVQQQLTQLMEEITNVNEQIKDATTNLTSEPMVECQSNKNSRESIPKHNMVNTDWIFTNKATRENKKDFKEYIKYLCESKASASDIKKYINKQEKDCILVHIKLRRQYEILSKIGVDFKEKTYLNA